MRAARKGTAAKRLAVVAAALVTAMVALSLSSSVAIAKPSATPLKVGFIMVGSRNDFGYNQAVFVGSKAVAKMKGVEVVTTDSVPENKNATIAAMESMAGDGVKVIFATSYGYFPYAQEFAADNPDVIVVHQGGFFEGTFPANFGTYWGQAFEPVSLGGMAAGAATKSNKLGYVYAYPIPQTIANINAFQLGAQSVNKKAKTYTVNTSSWCDPLKQKTAASALLAQGIDVLTQHQDCQATIVGAAKSGKAFSVGYHYNALPLNPDGWLTGSVWAWGPLYQKIVATVLAGKFTGSVYNANWVGSFQTKNNPLTLAPFGKSVTPAMRTKIMSTLASLKKPGASVFKGPIYCQDGKTLVKPGVTATYAQINAFACLVKGVVGKLPS
jgi:basic membrane protein A